MQGREVGLLQSQENREEGGEGRETCDHVRSNSTDWSFPSHADARTHRLHGAMILGMDELMTLTRAAGAGRVCQ